MDINDDLTQDELKRLFKYDIETGNFINLTKTNRNVLIGDIAGTKHKSGYIHIGITKKVYLAHRLVWLYIYGKFPDAQIDHINGIKSDNRLINLREATSLQNMRNIGITKTNTSGYKGVCFNKRDNNWLAQAKLHGTKMYLGAYSSPELASDAYQEFATKHHGEFKYA